MIRKAGYLWWDRIARMNYPERASYYQSFKRLARISSEMRRPVTDFARRNTPKPPRLQLLALMNRNYSTRANQEERHCLSKDLGRFYP